MQLSVPTKHKASSQHWKSIGLWRVSIPINGVLYHGYAKTLLLATFRARKQAGLR